MSGVSAITEWYAHRGVRATGFLPVVDRAKARYSVVSLLGNGLEKLGYVSESALVTRKFKNFIKSCGIFSPCFRDKAVLQFGKTMWRFDTTKSNSRFKYEFFKSGGSLAELRTFPKRPFRPVKAYRDQTRGGTLTRAHKTLPGAAVWKPVRVPRKERLARRAKRGGNGPRQSTPNPGVLGPFGLVRPSGGLSKRASGRLVRAAQAVSYGSFVKILGGVTVGAPPRADLKKYNYFFRKRGMWYPSLHHPLEGDRHDLFKIIMGANPSMPTSGVRFDQPEVD